MKKILFGIVLMFIGILTVSADMTVAKFICDGHPEDQIIMVRGKETVNCNLYVYIESQGKIEETENVSFSIENFDKSKLSYEFELNPSFELEGAIIGNSFHYKKKVQGIANKGLIGNINFKIGDLKNEEVYFPIKISKINELESDRELVFSFYVEDTNTNNPTLPIDDNPTPPISTLNSDSSLSKIMIQGYELNFTKEKKTYQLNIKNETSLNISCVPSNPDAQCEIIGNENLKNGSSIDFKVTAVDQTSTIYTINISKSMPIEYFIIGVLGLLVIILIVVLYISKTRKPKVVNLN